jgi:hypothetical protein
MTSTVSRSMKLLQQSKRRSLMHMGTMPACARDATGSRAMGSAGCLSFDSAVTSHATRIGCAASTRAWALPQSSQPVLVVRMMGNAGAVQLVWALWSGVSSTGLGAWPPPSWPSGLHGAPPRRAVQRPAGCPERHRPQHLAGALVAPGPQCRRARGRLPCACRQSSWPGAARRCPAFVSRRSPHCPAAPARPRPPRAVPAHRRRAKPPNAAGESR